jgi:hypothetical protein
MFVNLTDFGFRRTRKQAIGFYIVYLVVSMVLSSVVSYFVLNNQVFYSEEEAFTAGVEVGSRVAIVVVLVLAALVLNGKKLITNPKSIVIGFIGVGLAFVGGGLLGLIPVAYLTTQEKMHKENNT